LTNARRIAFVVVAVVSVAGSGGCAIDWIYEAQQHVGVTLTDKKTSKPVGGAVICWRFQAEGSSGLNPEDVLKYKRAHNLDCGTTDVQGVARLPVTTDVSSYDPVPDLVTGGTIAFRVDSRGRTDFIFGKNLNIGDVLPGRNFDLKIVDIAPPARTKG
jgi:hypothetical protein